jgi:hypothetical protein
MKMRLLIALSLLGLCVAPATMAATTDTQLTELRKELDAMRAEYEHRIAALEARLKKAEAAASEAKSRPAPPPVPAPAPAAPAVAANAFNPAVSVILNGEVHSFSRDPASFAIPGFALGPEVGPGDKGISLGESELNLNANIDDKFYGSLTTSLATEDGETAIDLEEAYIETLALPAGLHLKGGRFFSGIGYLNPNHAHTDDFADRPLPYQTMLANQYGDAGVQLTWVAPTDTFVELGGELLRGDRFPAGGAASGGKGVQTLFVHTGGDVGVSNSWGAGLSYLNAKADERTTGDAGDVFTGDSKLTLADFVWKWAPNGNPYRHNFKLQGEYFWRSEDGTFNDLAYSGDQQGWYLQGVYQFVPRWRVGLRWDGLSADNTGPAVADSVLDDKGHDPYRVSTMVDWANSEFSRLRLQYTRDETQPEADDQWTFQYNVSIGAHGAHRY